MSNPGASLCDLEAERSVLGASLADPRCLAEVAALVTAEDFHHPAHGAVFGALVALDKDSEPIDVLTVQRRLERDGAWERLRSVGGADFLAGLLLDVSSFGAIAHHAQVIARKAERREWVRVLGELRARGVGDSDDVEFLAEAEVALMALTARRRTEQGPRPLRQVMRQAVTAIEQRYENRKEHAVTGVSSGLADLDVMTCGWQPGNLVVVAARPGMGKSAMAMTTAVAAAKSGIPVLVFSLEMTAAELCERMVAMEGDIDSKQLRTGMITPKTWVRLGQTFGRISELPLWIDDQSALKIGDIRSRARRWRMNDAGSSSRVLIIVDYIGLARPDNPNPRMREREVAEISNGLKALAKDLDSPVIALSQLNRGCESRTNKRPMLSDIRESGSVEQDADVIAFLYRDEYYHGEKTPPGQCKECEPGVAEIILAKQRSGATGVAHVGWRAMSTKFVDLSRRD